MWTITGWKDLQRKLKPYRFAFLVLAAGIFLLLLPTGVSDGTEKEENRTEIPEDVWLRNLQEELTETLSCIEGVGRLTLMLSVETGMQKELARDSESDLQEGESHSRRETVILSSAGGGEEIVVTRSGYPIFRGAVVVCEGGNIASVRLAITGAVTALTGLSSDKISVIKGNVK